MAVRRRLPIYRIILAFVLALGLVALGAWRWIEAVAERRWASVERRIVELRAEAIERDCPRPPRPELVPGNAWDDYLEALDLLSKIPGIGTVYPETQVEPTDRALLESLLNQNPRVLELVRRGARRGEARHPDLVERASNAEQQAVLSLQRLIPVCSISSRRLARNGRIREAADVLLDLIQVGNDASRNSIRLSTWYTGTLHQEAFVELVPLARGLPTADLREIAGDLARLEADLYPCEAQFRDLLPLFARLIDQEDLSSLTVWQKSRFGFSSLTSPTTWQKRRFAFSKRLMVAAAFDRSEELLQLTAGIDVTPFAQADALLDGLRAQSDSSGNLVLGMFFPLLMADFYAHRTNHAKLRLLRAAFHERASGERLDLADPFGTTLRWSAPGMPLVIWSAGQDGKDDGGCDERDIFLAVP